MPARWDCRAQAKLFGAHCGDIRPTATLGTAMLQPWSPTAFSPTRRNSVDLFSLECVLHCENNVSMLQKTEETISHNTSLQKLVVIPSEFSLCWTLSI